jgi:RNase adaptor protein for sRNA GlmZ degradation
MVDSKIHALEILQYALYDSKEMEKAEIIRKSMVELKRFEFKIDENIFFQEICGRKVGKRFLESQRIHSLEELVMKQYEYRMKYGWGLYKNISSMVDLNTDDCDELIYLD